MADCAAACFVTDAAGDRRKAAAHYNRLMALAKNSDSQRPELARARAYIAQQ